MNYLGIKFDAKDS